MRIKKCCICKEEKPISEFYRHKCEFDGYSYSCKICDEKRKTRYKRSKEGVASYMYSDQKHNAKGRGDEPPTYTRLELQQWLFNHPDFNRLFNAWVESGYDTWRKPSVDRIDDYKSYTLDNIQLTTWKKNAERFKIDQMNGVNTKQCKAVLQYDLEGNFIAEYYSQHQASRELGIPQHYISRVCCGDRKQTKGYMFRFK